MRYAVVLVLLHCAVGCSAESVTFDDGVVRDLAAPVDMTDLAACFECAPFPRLGCMDLIACINMCTTTACNTKCHKMVTTQANAIYKALDDCIAAHCMTAPDGGTGPCAGTDMAACNTCLMNTQSGTSPTGRTNGTCTPTTDPICGFCVDQLLVCVNDQSM